MVSIEAKEQVRLFLEKVDPEKFKERYRYLWLGLNLLILEIPLLLREKIEIEIEAYKNRENLSKFMYSKSNTLFLIDLCEREIARAWNNKDFRITKELVDFGVNKALILDPYGGIQLKKDNDEILRFSRENRRLITIFIYNIIRDKKITNPQAIYQYLVQSIQSSNYREIKNAVNTYRLQIPLKDYFLSLISLILRIRSSVRKTGTINATEIANDLDLHLPFGRKIISSIYNILKETFPEDY